MKVKPLISLGIPTYNRGHLLPLFFDCLKKALLGVEEKFEIIISDNCSTDNTYSECVNFVEKNRDVINVKYIRNDSNIGASKNLINLFYISNSEYFMFIGDDDSLHGQALRKVISIIESMEKPISSIIQGVYNNKTIASPGFQKFVDIGGLFYWFGNAYFSIVKRELAVAAVNKRNLQNKISNICWPQTVMGYLAVFDSDFESSIFITDFPIGGPLEFEAQTIYSSFYFEKSFCDLLEARRIVGCAIKSNKFIRQGLSFSEVGFIRHIQGLFHIRMCEGKSISLSKTKTYLRKFYGFRGYFASLIFCFLENYYLCLIFSVLIGLFKFRTNPFSKLKSIRREQLAYYQSIDDQIRTKKKHSDIF